MLEKVEKKRIPTSASLRRQKTKIFVHLTSTLKTVPKVIMGKDAVCVGNAGGGSNFREMG